MNIFRASSGSASPSPAAAAGAARNTLLFPDDVYVLLNIEPATPDRGYPTRDHVCMAGGIGVRVCGCHLLSV